ncbi:MULTISPECIES: sigma-70 family RNA polymerase sigma factor [Bacillus]|nr:MULTISPECIES: sigma-70 family RNA polymerase sigma factor [Bacillus]MBP1079798.1 DNA-directed RNA polymerase [Bacillus capparidis]MED1095190.1 sigma-70 family RNA polymerase sigma factor [Bacillus capparidis]
MTYEQILKDHERMIFYLLKHLNIYKDRDEYIQIAYIALWECTIAFDPKKGNFSSFAFASVRGKLINELKRRRKHEERNEYKEVAASYYETPFIELVDEWERKAEEKKLTDLQKKWLFSAIRGETLQEIAERNNCSVAAVKSWRKQALKKLGIKRKQK